MDSLETLKQNCSDEASKQDWDEISKAITTNVDVMDGLPIFVGTRIPVYIILDYLAEGLSVQDIKKDFPFIHRLGQIKPTLALADDIAHHVVFDKPADFFWATS